MGYGHSRYQSNVNFFEPLPNSVLLSPRSAAQHIIVQKIRYYPTTYIDGTVLTFTDSVSGNILATMQVAPMVVGLSPDANKIDFDEDGVAMMTGASLILNVISGGISGSMQIDSFQLPVLIMTPYVAPQTAGFTA